MKITMLAFTLLLAHSPVPAALGQGEATERTETQTGTGQTEPFDVTGTIADVISKDELETSFFVNLTTSKSSYLVALPLVGAPFQKGDTVKAKIKLLDEKDASGRSLYKFIDWQNGYAEERRNNPSALMNQACYYKTDLDRVTRVLNKEKKVARTTGSMNLAKLNEFGHEHDRLVELLNEVASKYKSVTGKKLKLSACKS